MSRQLEIDFSGSNSMNSGMQSPMLDLLTTPVVLSARERNPDRVMRPVLKETINADMAVNQGHRQFPHTALEASAAKVSPAIVRS